METKVYVYAEYCDSDSFGEMITKVFAAHTSAQKHLRERVLEYCGIECSISEIEAGKNLEKSLRKLLSDNGYPLHPEDYITDDYVLLANENHCNHWKITACPVENQY